MGIDTGLPVYLPACLPACLQKRMVAPFYSPGALRIAEREIIDVGMVRLMAQLDKAAVSTRWATMAFPWRRILRSVSRALEFMKGAPQTTGSPCIGVNASDQRSCQSFRSKVPDIGDILRRRCSALHA